MHDVIEWFKRVVTILGITACICMFPLVDLTSAIFSMVPKNSANKLQLNCAYMSIFVVPKKYQPNGRTLLLYFPVYRVPRYKVYDYIHSNPRNEMSSFGKSLYFTIQKRLVTTVRLRLGLRAHSYIQYCLIWRNAHNNRPQNRETFYKLPVRCVKQNKGLENLTNEHNHGRVARTITSFGRKVRFQAKSWPPDFMCSFRTLCVVNSWLWTPHSGNSGGT